MLLEKVPWCTHDGGIFTIHVQSSGLRFATGGADSQVKIWSMAPVADVQKEKAGPLVLATLTDHSSSVNTVRFSHSGKFLASGSDDHMTCIFEHRPGPGATALGGGTNIENWRLRQVLRGHSNNVVDLGWSPDDSKLATASIDNAVCIWDAASGQRLKTLDYHTSFVKGLSWDPVGTYLATQSEDKSVVIWRCDDWSIVSVVRAPYARLITSTFSTRMSWSPDGSFLATGNSYQGSSHAAVVIQRGLWAEDKEHMLVSGHQGCVVSVGFNPRLFHLPKKGGKLAGDKGSGGSSSNGVGAEGVEVEEKLSSVFALGSQDKRISVWAAAQATPMMVGKRLFRNQVTDLAWTPDGFTLLASSSDGTVACFQFAASELGKPHTREELDQIFEQLYGSARGTTGKRLFAESADQLNLEAAAAAAAGPAAEGLALSGGSGADALLSLPVPVPVGDQRRQQAGAAAALPPAARQQQAAVERTLQPSAKQNLDALSARLSGRMGSGEVQLGFDAPAVGEGAPGRKRLAPEPIGAPTSAELMPPPPPRPSAGVQQAEGKRVRLEPTPAAAAGGGSGRAAQQAAAVAAAAAGLAAPVQAAEVEVVLRREVTPSEVVADLGRPPVLFADPSAAPVGRSRQLRITNRTRGPAGVIIGSSSSSGPQVQAEVVCKDGDEVVWRDVVRGAAVAACGTHHFAAVGMQDGQLLLYSRSGRHLVAPIKLGRGIARVACDSAWRVLAVTTGGAVRLFDVEALRSLLNVSLLPLLEDGSCTVMDARLSRMGVPLVTLSNSRAYVWNADMEGWACVADEAWAASQYMPLLSLSSQGEVSSLQASVLRSSIPRASLPGMQVRLAPQQQQVSRAHLEASLSTALALQSPQEYRRWLLAYAGFLAQHADAARLAEVCGALLGGAQGTTAAAGGGGGGGDVQMVDAAAGAGTGGGEAGAMGEGGSAGAHWQPSVLGIRKWDLLRDVLREMSRNRSLQRTTQTYNDALTELERAAAAAAAREAQGQAAGGEAAVGSGPAPDPA